LIWVIQIDSNDEVPLQEAINEAETVYYRAITMAMRLASAGEPPQAIPIPLQRVLLEACAPTEASSPKPLSHLSSSPHTLSSPSNEPAQKYGALVQCIFHWNSGRINHCITPISYLPSDPPLAQTILNSFNTEAELDHALHRHWRHPQSNPKQYTVYTQEEAYTSEAEPNEDKLVEIGPLDSILDGISSKVLPEATGDAAIALTKQFNMGTYLDSTLVEFDEDPFLYEKVWLPEANVFCIVIKEHSEVVCMVPYSLHRMLTFEQINALEPMDAEPPELSQRLNDTQRAQVYLSRNYAAEKNKLVLLVTRISQLNNIATTRPFYTRIVITIVNNILVKEGFDLTSPTYMLSNQQIRLSGYYIDWATILRWATGDRHVSVESWRQRHSRLFYEKSHKSWMDAYKQIRDVLDQYLDIPAEYSHILQDLEPVKRILELLQTLTYSCQELAADASKPFTDDDITLMMWDWSRFGNYKRAMKDMVLVGERAAQVLGAMTRGNSRQLPPGFDLNEFWGKLLDLVELCLAR
jgi:hypothetical protein